jgi:hypothetical protein
MPPLELAVLATVKTGRDAFTVIVIAVDAIQLEALIALREYTVVDTGETTIEEVLAPVLHE